MPTSETHDYGPGKRGIGRDYTFTPINGGLRAHAAGWGSGISAGDYLLLEDRRSLDGRTRYRVEIIRYEADPKDMWSADLSFAPRRAAQPAGGPDGE